MPLDCLYPFEEFAQHLDAMKQVYQWKDTAMFGSLEKRDPNSAHSARVIEYFSDCYSDNREMGQKSMCFFAVHDYISAHFKFFRSKGFTSGNGAGMVEIDRVLFRAVHLIFTHRGLGKPAVEISPRRVARLSSAFRNLETPDFMFWK